MAASARSWPLVFVLALAVGAPRPLLQSLAWFRMLAAYSRTATLSQAISMTFDGKHPCRLCRLIQQGQTQERQQQRTVQLDHKLELGLPPTAAILAHPPLVRLLPSPAGQPVCSRDPPAVPPPRFT